MKENYKILFTGCTFNKEKIEKLKEKNKKLSSFLK